MTWAGTVTMSTDELDRLVERRLTQRQAAEQLGVSAPGRRLERSSSTARRGSAGALGPHPSAERPARRGQAQSALNRHPGSNLVYLVAVRTVANDQLQQICSSVYFTSPTLQSPTDC